jgi:hypothetical protein
MFTKKRRNRRQTRKGGSAMALLIGAVVLSGVIGGIAYATRPKQEDPDEMVTTSD